MAERSRTVGLVAVAAVTCVAAALFADRAPVAAALIGVAAAFVATGVVTVTVFVVVAWRHALLSLRLRSCSHDSDVSGIRVRLAPLSGAAFVAGLRRPNIYVDRRLPDDLSPRELEAVTLHERAHQLARDPLRLAALTAMASAALLAPGGRAFVERLAAQREIAADRYAIARGASRSSLASALLRVGPALHPVPGFSTAVDLRLRALLGEEEQPPQRRAARWRPLLLGVTFGLVACAVTMPMSQALASTLERCCF